MKKPNILFFMLDQCSAKWIEAALERDIVDLTNIRWLKENGVSFSNAITSNPVCCPARATIATGQTSRGHGVLENGYQLSPEIPTFMHVLQGNGWRTGALGKVHFQPHFRGLNPDYKPYGFNVTHITEDSRGGEWLDWVRDTHPEHYESVLATLWATSIPEFREYGKDKENLAQRIQKIKSTFEWATEKYPENTYQATALPFPEEVSQTNWITGHALHFIKETPADQPFMAHVSYVQPHGPFHVPEEYLEYVNVDNIPEPIKAEWVDDPNGPYELKRSNPIDIENRNWRFARRCYFADLLHLDKQLGKIIDMLKECNRLEDTYIMFTADHGEMLFDHGFTGKESKHYDACIRIPLVIAGPGQAKGCDCDQFVQLEDICPTILEITDCQLPPLPLMGPYFKGTDEEIPTIAGQSLIPLCQNQSVDNWRQAAYSESYNRIDSMHPGQWARTIRTAKYRYTYYPTGYGEQLFDLENDPDECNNLVADPDLQAVKRDLKDQLMELIILQDLPKTRRDLFALCVH